MAGNPDLSCLLSWLLSSLPCTVQGQNYRELAYLSNFHFSKGYWPLIFLQPTFPSPLLSEMAGRSAGVCLQAPPPLPSTHQATIYADKAHRWVSSLNRTPGPGATCIIAALDTFNQMLLCMSLSCSQWYCVCLSYCTVAQVYLVSASIHPAILLYALKTGYPIYTVLKLLRS